MSDNYSRILEGIEFAPNGGFTGGYSKGLSGKTPVTLSEDHMDFLRWSNGLVSSDGYMRIFGIGNGVATELFEWNRPESWKFAWKDEVRRFFCFGQTAWGDQYAYRLLPNSTALASEIHVLGAFAMDTAIVASSFPEFLERVFVREWVNPSDPMTNIVKRKFRRLDACTNLIYAPSLLIGGEEVVENVMKMDSRTAMIVNGDVHTQLFAADENAVLSRVEDYTDSEGRARLRLVWG